MSAVSGEARPTDECSDQMALWGGIDAARQEGRPIDDRTAQIAARRLCNELAQRPDSALGALAACGVILEDEVYQELYVDVDGQTPGQQRLVDALYTYCIRREDKGPVARWGRDSFDRETPSGIQPEICVGSLSDYNAGVLHGMWIDAYQEQDAIRDEVSWILRTSPTARATGEPAEEYGIFDYSGFGGLHVDEYEPLETVSRLANGIAEHGEAFAALAEYVGTNDVDYVERTFEDAYRGHWGSTMEYVENYLEECEAYGFMDYVSEWLRPYVKIDTEMVARDTEIELYVVETSEGRVLLFDTRMS